VTVAGVVACLMLFLLRTAWIQREPDLVRARSRCNSR
jgi:hypothetical protein